MAFKVGDFIWGISTEIYHIWQCLKTYDTGDKTSDKVFIMMSSVKWCSNFDRYKSTLIFIKLKSWKKENNNNEP